MKNKVFTIGHSTHTIVNFINLLNRYGIPLVYDVRSQPYSKYNSQFNKDSIKKALSGSGIEYLFLGKELGGRSKNTSCYNDKGKLQYHLLAQESLFNEGLEKIIIEIKKRSVALMCSEGDPLKCHRTILVCRQLYQTLPFSKDNIQHILPDGSLQTNTEMEKSLLDKFKIFPDMLRNEEECITEAYNRQAQKIAYTYQENSALLEESQPGVSPFF